MRAARSLTKTAGAVKRFTGWSAAWIPSARHLSAGGRGGRSDRSDRAAESSPNGKRCARTFAPRTAARQTSIPGATAAPDRSGNAAIMALLQRRGGEMPQCSEPEFFSLIRATLKSNRPPAYVGFCANPIDPDGERAPMGWHGSCPQSRLPGRSHAVRHLHASATALPTAAGQPRTGGMRRLRRAAPTSAWRGEPT